MKTIDDRAGPFAVFSRRARQPAGARGDPRRHRATRGARRSASATSSATGLPQRGRPARARARHPHPHGQLRPGHRLRDRRLRLRLQDRRAARRGRRLTGMDHRGRGERGQAAYLRTLEDHFVLETPAGDLLAVHGSPRRINEYLFEDRPASAMARMAAQYPYRAILFGHTHIPYVREVRGTAFVNVGSGGRPKDGDWRVCYAIVDPAASSSSRARGRVRARGVRLRAADRGPQRDVADHGVHSARRSLSGPACAQAPAGKAAPFFSSNS